MADERAFGSRASSSSSHLEELALSIAKSFGDECISRDLAEGVKALFPDAEFVRVSLRSGTGLFVTDNLLQEGYSMISLVSLKNSLSAHCMKLGSMLELKIPDGFAYECDQEDKARVIGIAPAPVPCDRNDSPEHFIGTLIVGMRTSQLDEVTMDRIQSLGDALGESLLTVGVSNVSHLAHLLSIRDQDSQFIGAEEALQDLPLDVPRPCCLMNSSEDSGLETAIDLGLDAEEQESSDDEFSLMKQDPEELNDNAREESANLDQGEKAPPSSYGVEGRASGGNGAEDACCSQGSLDVDLSEGHHAIKGKDRSNGEFLPDVTSVRVFGTSLVFTVGLLGAIWASASAPTASSVLPLIAALLSLGSSASMLFAKKSWFGAQADVYMAAFCLLTFFPSIMDIIGSQDDVAALKRDVLRCLLIFESTLFLCLVRRQVSHVAHLGACLSLTAAVLASG